MQKPTFTNTKLPLNNNKRDTQIVPYSIGNMTIEKGKKLLKSLLPLVKDKH